MENRKAVPISQDKTVFKKNEETLESTVDQSTIIADLKNGRYYETNATGAKIWKLLEKPVTLMDIMDSLQGGKDRMDKEDEAAVCYFMEALRELKLVEAIHSQ